MSLIIYPYDTKPDIIENDAFFNESGGLRNDEMTKFILDRVEHAKYLSPHSFINRDGTSTECIYLSTGCKTLLNILYNPTVCFATFECGAFALWNALRFNEGKIIWNTMFSPIENDIVTCDVIYEDKHYTDVHELMEAID